MSNEQGKNKIVCPICGGSKTVPGTCTCDMEWRGNTIADSDEIEDCQCTPEIPCPNCKGSGFVDS